MLFFNDYSEENPEMEATDQSAIDFSCFAHFRSEAGGVKLGTCPKGYPHPLCRDCAAYDAFYGKAEEYQRAGNGWGRSVALAKRFFGIPTVPEWDVEAYPEKS